MSDDLSLDNVIAVTFDDDSKAFDALTKLKELDSQGQLQVRDAAVVARGEDGQITVKDHVSDASLSATATGGLLGLLVGILGGPFGILIAGATGLLIGSLFDAHDADENESVLSEISTSIAVGRVALLAEVTEQSPDVIDTAMERLGGTVLRQSVDDVQAEIAGAEKAQREARREARKQLLEARHEKRTEAIRAKIDELKAKLTRRESRAPVTS